MAFSFESKVTVVSQEFGKTRRDKKKIPSVNTPMISLVTVTRQGKRFQNVRRWKRNRLVCYDIMPKYFVDL